MSQTSGKRHKTINLVDENLQTSGKRHKNVNLGEKSQKIV